MRPLAAGSAALALALLACASPASAGTPQQRIFGPGASPGFGDEINFTVMNICPGPIGSGWGVYGSVGWSVAQQFVPTVTNTPNGVMVPVSDNGFPTFTLMASIYTDGGGGVPGTLLTTSVPITVTGAPAYPAAVGVRIKFSPLVTLTAGTTYVLLFETPSGACFVDGNATGACPGIGLQSLDFGVTWTALGTDVARGVFAP